MHAYIDETGNTGANLFDENQPEFMTAALVTIENFDEVYQQEVFQIAKSIGETSLHANLLGASKIVSIAGDLLNVLKKSKANFFISSIEKRYLVAAKMIDTLFDSYENEAVPWHVYNLRPLRLLMVFRVASILTEDTAKKFMNSILERNEDRAYKLFDEALSEIKANVPDLKDTRSKQLINDAIDWARANPRSIYFHVNSEAARKGHLPNLVVFPNLLRGIEQFSKYYDSPVIEIIHDRQNEFQTMLSKWHSMFSNATPDVLSWPGEPAFSLQCVAGSKFRISNSNDSVGIQIVDIILWVFRRFLKGEPLGAHTLDLLSFVIEHGYQHALSFESVGRDLEEFMEQLFAKPLTEEDIEKARKLYAEAEKSRQKKMKKHIDKHKKPLK